MIAALADALLWPLLGLLGLIVTGFGAWAMGKREGKQEERTEGTIRQAQGYAQTRKAIDETDLGDDPDVLRDWLRSRAPDQR